MLARLLNPLTFFVAACAFLVFLLGFATSQFRWFPHDLLAPTMADAKRLLVGEGGRHQHLYLARHDFEGVRAYDKDGAAREIGDQENATGVTLISSTFASEPVGLGLRVIDRRGNLLHHWQVDVAEIWPDNPIDDQLVDFFNKEKLYLHGSYLFPNGDVLFNVEYRGLVRLNSRGEVVWTLNRRTHHSVHPTEDGNFWVCSVQWVSDMDVAIQRFLGLAAPLAEEVVLKVSPEGEVLREVSVLDALFQSEYRALIWTTGPNRIGRNGDIMHLNDVEPLPASMADQYPLFEAGDLLVSANFQNMVFVFDPDTGKVKWAQIWPNVRQHDPDFIGDGWVSVFDNRTDDSPAGNFLGGSRLLAFRPHTGEQKRLYPTRMSQNGRQFFTNIGGKAQLLDNGNWVMVESTGGRVFEVDQLGRTVWEWGIERVEDGTMVNEVFDGHRYPYSAAQVEAWPKR